MMLHLKKKNKRRLHCNKGFDLESCVDLCRRCPQQYVFLLDLKEDNVFKLLAGISFLTFSGCLWIAWQRFLFSLDTERAYSCTLSTHYSARLLPVTWGTPGLHAPSSADLQVVPQLRLLKPCCLQGRFGPSHPVTRCQYVALQSFLVGMGSRGDVFKDCQKASWGGNRKGPRVSTDQEWRLR